MRQFLLTILFIFLLAASLKSQDDIIISDSYTDIAASELLGNLERKYGIRFFYKSEWIDSVKLSHTGKSISLMDFLSSGLAVYGLSACQITPKDYVITKDYVIISEIQKTYLSEPGNIDSMNSSGFITGEMNGGEAREEYDLVIIGDPLKRSPEGTAEISGMIRELKTGEPIIGATVYINETQTGTITDLYGHYSIVIPAGRYNLTYRYIGMAEINQPVLVQSDGMLNMNMEEKLYRLREIVVEGKKSDNVTGSQMGLSTISIKSIKEIPRVLGEVDIIKAATMLPGVKSAGEGASGFYVRGGSSDQNLVLLDDAPIFNTAHLFGFFSAFNSDVIRDFELYKASIPAEYGGRLSSVFDISTLSGNKLKFSGNGGISPVTAQLLLEGPLVKSKSSFLVSGRSTYSDYLLSLIEDPDIKNSNASFYDINARLNWEINQNNIIDFSGYYSDDKFTLASETSYHYVNQNMSVHWKHKVTNKLYSMNTLLFSRYYYDMSSFKADVNGYEMDFSIGHKELKTNFTWLPNPEHKVNFGLNAIWYTVNPGMYIPQGDESQVRAKELEVENGVETSLFISDRFNITPNLSVYGGLRLSSLAYLGPKTVYRYNPDLPLSITSIIDTNQYTAGQVVRFYMGPEIRLSARYILDPASSLKMCYNRTRQYIHMLSNTLAISPTDTWKLTDANIPPQIADQVSFGYYRNFMRNTIESSVEVYYKWIQNMLDYKAGAELLLNEHIETDLLTGTGRAYGIEFFLRKEQGRLNGWLSYTWSRSLMRIDGDFEEEKINGGQYFPTFYDKPHDVSLLTNYRFSRRFSFSSNLAYSSGRPITYPAAKFYFRNVSRLYYSLRNEYRIPDYFRWDVSMNIEGNLKSKKLLHSSWTVSVYNVTGRDNAYSVYFISEDGVINGYKLSIFAQPIYTITYHFRF